MSTPATQRPNIIFIVADDLGFADLGCYGGRDAQFGGVSPVLDQLAANGLKFTNGYANSPVCSPQWLCQLPRLLSDSLCLDDRTVPIPLAGRG
ncbi:MAG: Arylsulfatase [Pseudomonadota bacterium]